MVQNRRGLAIRQQALRWHHAHIAFSIILNLSRQTTEYRSDQIAPTWGGLRKRDDICLERWKGSRNACSCGRMACRATLKVLRRRRFFWCFRPHLRRVDEQAAAKSYTANQPDREQSVRI